jgi:hypothetical protein
MTNGRTMAWLFRHCLFVPSTIFRHETLTFVILAMQVQKRRHRFCSPLSSVCSTAVLRGLGCYLHGILLARSVDDNRVS